MTAAECEDFTLFKSIECTIDPSYECPYRW
jgi:hypothetical protein